MGAMRTIRAVLASAVASGAVLAGFSVPARAAVTTLPMTLSPGYGPSGGGNLIVGTVTPNSSAPTPFPANTTPVVQFQYIGGTTTACNATAKPITQIAASGATTTAGVVQSDPDLVKRITTSKIVFPVPSGAYPGDSNNTTGLVLAGSQNQAKWSVCIYDSASTTASNLLASATYTLALKPTITSITPTSSPAAGGATITVNGTGFTPATSGTVSVPLTASIGGVALTNIKVAANGNSFTATTAQRAAQGGLAVVVTAPGGTVSSLDPDNDPGTSNPIPFEYTNGITISPNTGASGTAVTIDVTGAGFKQLSFDSGITPTSASAHVFLVKDAYDSSSNRGVAECVVGVVVSDTELICDLNLAANRLSPTTSAAVPGSSIVDGAYILTVVADGSIGSGVALPSIISSGAAFIVAPY